MSHRHKHPPHEKPPEGDQPPPAGEAPAAGGPPSPGEPAPDPTQTLRAERDDLLARLQRVCADYANYQKRAQRDLAQHQERANEALMKALVPILDDMERALQAARETAAPDDPLLRGMSLVHEKALETLGRFGLTVLHAEGGKFDPEKHAAVLQKPSEDQPPMTVLEELQKGYQLKGRTIRPASVVVSREPQAPGEAPGGEGEKEGESENPLEADPSR